LDKTDYEYLKSAQLDPLKPQFSEEVMFSVARILIYEEVLERPLDVLNFCERPDRYKMEIDTVLRDYEERNNVK
jgi:hypothetical protein